jgi:hypothetical protein
MNTNGEVISQNPTDMLEQARNYLQRVQFALQESTDFDEILGIRDRGEFFRQYSRQQHYGIEIQNAGAEIKIRAERRMGELCGQEFAWLFAMFEARPSGRNMARATLGQSLAVSAFPRYVPV